MSKPQPGVIRGRMTEAEVQRVHALADQGFKCGQIAAKLNRHGSSVYYIMLRDCLLTSIRDNTTRDHMRGGVHVLRFTPEEDKALEEIERQCRGPTAIAKAMTERFPDRPRAPNSVRLRLMQLAAKAENGA